MVVLPVSSPITLAVSHVSTSWPRVKTTIRPTIAATATTGTQSRSDVLGSARCRSTYGVAVLIHRRCELGGAQPSAFPCVHFVCRARGSADHGKSQRHGTNHDEQDSERRNRIQIQTGHG